MTTYIAKVYGVAWAGYKASTEYTFYHKPTRDEIVKHAGDFQEVTRIELASRTTTWQKEKAL